MKPLVLTVHPKSEVLDAYKTPDGSTVWYTFVVDEIRASKRLTNAELAAEYWRADADAAAHCHADSTETTWPEDYDKQAETLLRIARAPHYDEEVTP